MQLRDFFEQPLAGTPDEKGSESAWLDLCTLTLSSGTLAFGDPCYFPGLQVQLEVEVGLYQVQAKVRDFGTGRRVSALRALLEGSSIHQLVASKSIAVDTGRAAVCDYQRFKTVYEAAKQATPNFPFLNYFSGRYGVIQLGEPPVAMAYVGAGWGDDIYDVSAYLNAAGKGIGGEVIFIENDLDLMDGVEAFQITTHAELEAKAKQKRADES